MDIFAKIKEYEDVIFCTDDKTGLKAIIALHNTALGPAIGGCRCFSYLNEEQALQDVLKLSKAMTYKAAGAGLPLGGAKSVIWLEGSQKPTKALYQSFASHVAKLQGLYYAAEDVGTPAQAVEWMQEITPYVCGLPQVSGDPSIYTATGVFYGIQASLDYRFGHSSCKGKVFALQGLGSVGMHLAKFIHEQQGQLIVCDLDSEKLAWAQQYYQAKVVSPEQIYAQDCDVFCPNAMGAVVNDHSIDQLQCSIIAGAANNVLAHEQMGQQLKSKGILYAPDFIINAGGLINCCTEVISLPKTVLECIEDIKISMTKIFQIAEKEDIDTQTAAYLFSKNRYNQLLKGN